MRIILDTRRTVEQNAADHFERAKKAKRKIEGTERAIARTRDLLARQAAGLAAQADNVRAKPTPSRRRDWFEAFRWFTTSDGFLCVGGRDSTTNEVVIKKHAQEGDLVFHTEMAGSPFLIIKTEGREPPETSLEEAAQFTASVSRAWRGGLSSAEVFRARPDQVSKTPNPGEYIAKGAFMVRGARGHHMVTLAFAVGRDAQGRIMGGPPSAVRAHCADAFAVLQGDEKPSDVAKRLAKLLDATPDDILRALPAGGVRLGAKL